MFDLGFPEDRSTLRKLLFLKGSGIVGGRDPLITLSGSIVRFTSARSRPIKQITGEIKPVQDLHGYAHPWPGGGGVNRFDESTVTHGWWSGTGSFSPTDTYAYVSVNIPVTGGEKWGVKSFGTKPYSMSLVEFDSGGAFIHRGHTNAEWFSETLPENTAYLALQVAQGTSGTITPEVLSTFKIVLYKGATAPASYSPYGNICPVSGWTGVNVYDRGINLWDEEWEQGGIDPDTGADTGSAAYTRIRSKNFIPVVSGQEYELRQDHMATPYANGVVVWYDRDGNYLSGQWQSLESITPPSGAKAMRFCTGDAYGSTYREDITFCLQSESTDSYRPCSGQSRQILFTHSGDPLTVYGGRLVWKEDGSVGVTAAYASGDLAALPWSYDGQRWQVSVPDLKDFPARSADIFFEKYGSSVSASAATENVGFTVGKAIYIYSGDPVNAPTGQFVYPLAAPVEYELACVTMLSTLAGVNNLWTDTGGISVTAYGTEIEEA